MDAQQVTRLFPSAANRRTTRVGLEHELLTRDTTTGAATGTSGVTAATCSRVNGPVSREWVSRVLNTTGWFDRALTSMN